MKTMVVPLRIPSQLYREIQSQAKRRDKRVSEMLRETIRYGLSALPALPETSAAVLDAWEKLGPAPDIDYENCRIERRLGRFDPGKFAEIEKGLERLLGLE